MNQNNAAQAAMQRPIDEAIVILTEEAAALRECHTPSGDRDDWTGESEAKGAHDNMLRVADALSKLRAPASSIREAFELTYAADADDPASATELSHFTNGWRACVMSQVRAPVADEHEDFEAWRKHALPWTTPATTGISFAWDAWQARAAPASAPVSEPETMEEIHRLERERAPRVLPKDPTLPASAPVAGEAKNYPGDNVAERLDNMADDQPPGSQAQSDLYAAATIWRKHITHRAAPQASECECARKSKAVADSEAEL